MKKNKTEFILLFIVSLGLGILLPNFGESTISIPEIVVLTKWTLGIFVLLTMLYFAKKPSEKEHTLRVSDGYHELYNEKGQVTKKGMFERGRLYNGSIYTYKKDGTLLHTETIKEGKSVNQSA